MTTQFPPVAPQDDDRPFPTDAGPPAATSFGRTTHAGPIRAGIVTGTALLLVVGAAVTMGASTAPTGSADATSGGTGTTLTADHAGGPIDGGFGRHGIGAGRFGGVGITAISGSSLSLETVDGWTRTIEVTDATEITKAGETIGLGELAVGDDIRFAQTRNDDGSFSITRIDVVPPHVAGTVTATTADTITVTDLDGESVTIHVDADTTFRIAGVEDATIDDVTADMRIVARGTERADGSLEATDVASGRMGRLHHGMDRPPVLEEDDAG